MAAEMFDKFNSFTMFFLPEFQVSIRTCRYDEICSKANELILIKLKLFSFEVVSK